MCAYSCALLIFAIKGTCLSVYVGSEIKTSWTYSEREEDITGHTVPISGVVRLSF